MALGMVKESLGEFRRVWESLRELRRARES